MGLYICENFHTNILNGFNLQSGQKNIAEMAKFNVQRAITPKVGKPESTVHEFCTSFHSDL